MKDEKYSRLDGMYERLEILKLGGKDARSVILKVRCKG